MDKNWLFIKPIIQEWGTECGECRERGECLLGFREISRRIPGNVLILEFQEMFKKISGNFPEYSGEYYSRFRGALSKIPRNVLKISANAWKDSGECS